MKKLVFILIACVVGSFTSGCSSDAFQEDRIVAQPNLSLVSPEGVRIANSLDDLANLPYMDNGKIVDAPVRITKIEYSWDRNTTPFMESIRYEKGTAIQALIHYTTATGKPGQWVIG